MTAAETPAETVRVRSMAIVPGANPFEVFLLFACVVLSITRPLGIAPPSTLATVLPSWAVTLWYANLGIGSAIAIYGGLRRRKVSPGHHESTLLDGLIQYLIGWSYIGTASLTYGLLLLVLHPEAGVVAGTMTTAWGLASLFRAYQVNRHTKRSRVTWGGGRHKDV